MDKIDILIWILILVFCRLIRFAFRRVGERARFYSLYRQQINFLGNVIIGSIAIIIGLLLWFFLR